MDRSRPRFERVDDERVTAGLPTVRLHYLCPGRPWAFHLTTMLAMWWAYRGIVRDGFKPDVIHANVYETGWPPSPRHVAVVSRAS